MTIDLSRWIRVRNAVGGGFSFVNPAAPLPYQSGAGAILAAPRFVESEWLFDVIASGGGIVDSFNAARDPDDVIADTEFSYQATGGPYVGAGYSQAVHAGGTGLSDARLVGSSAQVGTVGGPAITLEMYGRVGVSEEYLPPGVIAQVFSEESGASISLGLFGEGGPTEERDDAGIFFQWFDFSAGFDQGVMEYKSAGLNDGEWHHVAAVITLSTARLFVDGAEVTPSFSDMQLSAFASFPWSSLSGFMFLQSAEDGVTTRIHGARFSGAALYSGAYSPPEFA